MKALARRWNYEKEIFAKHWKIHDEERLDIKG